MVTSKQVIASFVQVIYMDRITVIKILSVNTVVLLKHLL